MSGASFLLCLRGTQRLTAAVWLTAGWRRRNKITARRSGIRVASRHPSPRKEREGMTTFLRLVGPRPPGPPSTAGEKVAREAADKAAEHITDRLAGIPVGDPWRGELERVLERRQPERQHPTEVARQALMAAADVESEELASALRRFARALPHRV